MAKTRKELKADFEKEIFLKASFFKMKTLSNGTPAKDGSVLDATLLESKVNQHTIRPFPHPLVTQNVVSQREPMPKLKKIARGEQVTRINKANDAENI